MIKTTLWVRSGAAVLAAALGACSGPSYQQSLEPSYTQTNPLNDTLQFAVGTANVAGTIGLNTVETLRQNGNGETVLTNAPTIVGPPGFVVPATSDAGADAGTNSISGNLYTSLASSPPATTFDPAGGSPGIASDFGFGPYGVVNSNETPSLTPYPLPFYSANNAALTGDAAAPGPYYYIGGPPAFVQSGHTSTRDGTFPGGFLGYPFDWVDFQATPVAGTYTLNVVIPTGVNNNTGAVTTGTLSKTATLATLGGLPTWGTPPTFTPDGTGGGTITTNFTAGGGITEEFIELVNTGPGTCQGAGTGGAPYFYTFKVTPGTAAITVPDNMGAAEPGKAQGHTFCTNADNGGAGEDGWQVYGFAVDFPLAESGLPYSQGVVAPTITSGTQADVTTSLASAGPATTGGSHLRLNNGVLRTTTSVQRRR